MMNHHRVTTTSPPVAACLLNSAGHVGHHWRETPLTELCELTAVPSRAVRSYSPVLTPCLSCLHSDLAWAERQSPPRGDLCLSIDDGLVRTR